MYSECIRHIVKRHHGGPFVTSRRPKACRHFVAEAAVICDRAADVLEDANDVFGLLWRSGYSLEHRTLN